MDLVNLVALENARSLVTEEKGTEGFCIWSERLWLHSSYSSKMVRHNSLRTSGFLY